MSFFGSIGGFFKGFGSLVQKAFQAAWDAGLKDELIAQALALVKQAETQFTDNAAKREWVVTQLVNLGVNESLARLAVELGVRLLKKEADDAKAKLAAFEVDSE